ncbi:serine/threonine-protein kinase mos-like [Acanthaster planci]|uniref:non-specific serine/threonine protein kinase n=1 Tax=Acanthaster planci TaxID=133434 RepID=A0A8B7YF97_ACAPL|nr:serine/threonine-protein kinase mos-like [Acanthaster planci]
MTKIFQVIIRLLRRHLMLLGIYRKYLKRFRRYGSAENLCQKTSSEEDLIYLNRRKRRYHSVEEIDRDWYKTQQVVSYRELESMPCNTADNWARYEGQDSGIMVARRGSVNSAFVTNSAEYHQGEDTNGNCFIGVRNDNWDDRDYNASVGHADFSIDGVIGSGGFGSVFLGRYCGRRVAIKSVRQCSRNKEASRQSFKAEFNALFLRHENIVSVLATTAYEDFDSGAFIIMEYAGRKNLQQIINDPGKNLSPTRRTKYALHIIRALHYTHSQGIAHLDVKPANVIIDFNTDSCRLADFGCSQRVHDGEDNVAFTSQSYLTGTFAYRAPELLRGRPPTTKADIYSYGVTLWQMLTRETPFAGENHHVVIFGVVAHNLRPSLPENASEPWYESLVTRCWEGCVADRPSAADILLALESRTDAGDSQET